MCMLHVCIGEPGTVIPGGQLEAGVEGRHCVGFGVIRAVGSIVTRLAMLSIPQGQALLRLGLRLRDLFLILMLALLLHVGRVLRRLLGLLALLGCLLGRCSGRAAP